MHESDLNQTDTTAAIFEQHRRLLFAIAYRMLGSATDAEDIVQEAFVRWLQAAPADVQSPKAFLSRVVVHLCLDQLRSARVRREEYVGPWLPEPVATRADEEPAEPVMLAESLSFAFLVLLEQLAPLERAVFLLRDVFDYSYPEIAEIVGKSEANCRQALHRAREHLRERHRRFDVSRQEQERITTEFMHATMQGDMQGLLRLLSDDVVFVADSGGKAPAGRKPVRGRDNVARGMVGFMRLQPPGLQARVATVNGQPAVVGYVDGQLYGVMLLEVAHGQVAQVYMVLNPDKLAWLKVEAA
jgi:RNA polymerase sigma-70 factor (ECF subfamily)